MHQFGATQRLRPGQQGVQERAAGIGIHLDQLGAVLAQMKIIAHQRARRTGINLRNFRCPSHYGIAKGRDLRHRFNRRDGILHGHQCRGWHKHRHVGKQMRMGRGHLTGQARVCQGGRKNPAQFPLVNRDAKTALVQVRRDQTGGAGQQGITGGGHLVSWCGIRAKMGTGGHSGS